MKENIETKEVQRTEYLDKNGLDMLWAKVKENTHNQVEVERNRAVAKENSIIDTKADKSALDSYVLTTALAEYAKKTDIPEMDTSDFVSKSDTITQTINSGLIAIDKLQVFSKGYYDQIASLRGGIYVEGDDTKLTLNDTTASHNYMVLTASKLAMRQGIGGNTLLITTSGIANTDNNSDHVYATDGSIADLTQYAKKTDIPEVDTSDFVNKNADDPQIINSPLAFTNEVVIASDMEDGNTDYVALNPTELQFSENNYTSSIELNGKDTDRNAECSIQINASHGNSLIRLYSGIAGNENDESVLEITNSGISISNSQNENIGPDKVFATNGSVADLAQYVKKSEITTGGNVDDVQVNGVSVVENKIANINSATKESLGVVKVGDGLNVTDGVISVSAGNYLTYDSVVNESYYISSPKTFIFNGNDQDPALSIGNNHIIVGNNNTRMYSKMLDSYIELRADKNALDISCANITGNEYKGDNPTPYQQFVLNKKGVWLYGGDGNHVLTSNASTIDITQYVLKSVYDEKIAALEARIAALEAKHAETA